MRRHMQIRPEDIITVIWQKRGHDTVWLRVLIRSRISVHICKEGKSLLFRKPFYSAPFPRCHYFFSTLPILRGVLSPQIKNSLSAFPPDLNSFSSFALWSSFSLIIPQFWGNFEAFPMPPHLPPLDPSALVHFKPHLMMSDMNVPRAQTWVALWDSGQLYPKEVSGLIPYSCAASAPVPALCVPLTLTLSFPQNDLALLLKRHGAVKRNLSLLNRKIASYVALCCYH